MVAACQTAHARFHGASTGTSAGGRLAELSQTMLDMKFQLAQMAKAAQSRPSSPDAGPQHHQFNQVTNISQVSWNPHSGGLKLVPHAERPSTATPVKPESPASSASERPATRQDPPDRYSSACSPCAQPCVQAECA